MTKTESPKKVTVEYLYLDLKTCDRCIGTDSVLDEVMLTLTPALKLAGFEVEYRKIEMETAEHAGQYRFLSSPTIHVNGQDICESVAENSCGCCGEISGTDVDCRVFEYNGKSYEVPPKEMLADSILKAVNGQSGSGCSCESYKLPENLKTFYIGKNNKPACSCGGNCSADSMSKTDSTKSEGAKTGDVNFSGTDGVKSEIISVKVLGSGCAKCNQLEAAAKEALQRLGIETTIEHVTDFSQIAAYGVMSTPALVVDGKVVSYGKVLKADEIEKLLQKGR